MDDLVDITLDEYGDLVVGADGDASLVSGMDMLMQDIRHRLMTCKGSLPADPDYGGDLPLFAHMEDTLVNRKAVVNACLVELAKETRILPQRTTVDIAALSSNEVSLAVSFVRKSDLAEGAVEVIVS